MKDGHAPATSNYNTKTVKTLTVFSFVVKKCIKVRGFCRLHTL